jgi:hypothetical protein
MDEKAPAQESALFTLISFNVIASVLHYAHYFVYFRAYPTDPDWLSPPKVDLVWFLITIVGVSGYLLFKRRRYTLSFVLLYVYGLLSLGALGHYVSAPMEAYSLSMNLLICSQAVAAAALLVYVIWLQIHGHKDGDKMVFQ